MPISKKQKEWGEKVKEMHKDSLDNLPAKSEPSGFDKRVAHGSALVNSGMSTKAAAEAVGLEHHEFYLRHKKVLKSATREIKKEAERVITEQAVALTIAAQEKAAEMLENGEMRPAEVIKLVQTARDTVSQRYKWKDSGREGAEKTNNALASALAKFVDKLPTPDPVQEAIEVETKEE